MLTNKKTQMSSFSLSQKQRLLPYEIKKSLKHFCSKCQLLYNHLLQYINKYPQHLNAYNYPTLNFVIHKTQSNICAKIINEKTMAFRCFDCNYYNNSVLCVDCFQQGDHQGHAFQLFQSNGGCCDCGDEEKLHPQANCKKHQRPNIFQNALKSINHKQKQQFGQQIRFCFFIFFNMYDQAMIKLKLQNDSPSSETKKQIGQALGFGKSLFNYLQYFNKQSLISNILTFNMLNSKFGFVFPSFSFGLNSSQTPIYEIIMCLPELFNKFHSKMADFFMQLFTVKEFRKALTITFFKMYQKNTNFVLSRFHQLAIQLLYSHKLIVQLVQQKSIRPFLYVPKVEIFNYFEQLTNSCSLYFNCMKFLSNLYKQASLVYLSFHIRNGALPKLGYYRNLSYKFNQEVINKYFIEQKYILRVIQIIKVIKNDSNCVELFQKGISDLFVELQKIYLLNPLTIKSNNDRTKYIYIAQQLALSLFIFAYRQLVQSQYHFKEEQFNLKLLRLLIKSLNNKVQRVIQTVMKMLGQLNNNLIFSGLSLNHQQTIQRFTAYFNVTFRRQMTIISSVMYLYKVCLNLLKLLRIYYTPYNISVYLSQQSQFMRPKEHFFNIFNQELLQFNSDSIFDRCKMLITFNSFINLIIQITQTDSYQLIIGVNLDFQSKYQSKLIEFYKSLLHYYHRINQKNFKQISDSLFKSDQLFEHFITHDKDIQIIDGKINLKHKIKQQGSNYLNGLYYNKYLKYKLNLPNVTINQQKQICLISPPSKNHFIAQLMSPQLLFQLTNFIGLYSKSLLTSQMTVRTDEYIYLGMTIIQTIKIFHAIQISPSFILYKQSNQSFYSFLFQLYSKNDYIQHFSKDVNKIISDQIANKKLSQTNTIEQIEKQLMAEQKALDRKQKLLQRKNRKLNKFKQNQQKYQEKYSQQILTIRQQMQKQQLKSKQLSHNESNATHNESNKTNNKSNTIHDELNTNHNESNKTNIESNQIQNQSNKKHKEPIKSCIICHQTEAQANDLTIMCLMQHSSLYSYLLKQRQDSHSSLVFKGCGHYIHLNCHQKINPNKLSCICQYCKTTYNCLFPLLTYSHINIQQKKNLIIFNLLRMNEIQKQIDNDNQIIKWNDFISQFCNQLIRSIIEIIIWQVLINEKNQALQTPIKSIQNNKFFYKKQFQVYQNLLTQLYILSKEKIFTFEQNANQQNFPQQSATQQNKIQQNVTQQKATQQNVTQQNTTQQSVIQQNPLQKSVTQQNLTYKNVVGQNITQQNKYKDINFITLEVDYLQNRQKHQFNKFDYQSNSKQIVVPMQKYLARIIGYHLGLNQKIGLNQKNTLSYLRNQIGQKFITILDNMFLDLTLSKNINSSHNIICEKIQLQKMQTQKTISQKIKLQNIELQKMEKLKMQPSIIGNQWNYRVKLTNKFWRPPSTLQQLIKQRGRCPSCLTITSQLAICMICSWKTCLKCSVSPVFIHTEYHQGSAIYLWTNFGEIYYVSWEKYFIFPSIYQDFMGIPFKHHTKQIKLDRYRLNQEKLQDNYRSLLQFDIQTKIRYQHFKNS